MTNTKALGGGILGAVIGVAIAGPGAAGLFAFRGFAIGFSIGQLLFPPELTDDTEEDFDVTGPNPAAPVPVIWGHRHTPGSMTYFGLDNWEKLKRSDKRFYFAQMQLAVCVSPLARVKLLFSDLERYQPRAYFIASNPEIFAHHPSQKSWLGVENQVDQGITANQIAKRHSVPFLSQGGDPIDTQYWFKTVGLGGGYYETRVFGDGTEYEAYVPPVTFSDWPTKAELPPLKGIVTLSHPRWYMGEGTTAPSLKLDVYCEIDLSDSSFSWTVSYPELAPNAAYDTHLGMNPAHCYWDIYTNKRTFFGWDESILDEASFLYAEALFETEGYRLNAVVSSRVSAAALIEKLNFHTNSVVRSSPEGKLEILPLRRLDDVSNPVTDFQEETFDAAVPGRPMIYVVRDNDGRDIDVHTDTWDALPNVFWGKFPSFWKNFDSDPTPIYNEAGFEMTGRWVPRNYQFDWFTRKRPVRRRLRELMRFYSRPKSIASLVLDHRYNGLRKNDGILLYSSDFGLDGVYFRVSDVEYGDFGDSRITVKCALDVDSLSAGVDDTSEDDSSNGPMQTRLSALDVGGHVDYWPSNVAFKDTVSGAAPPERSPAVDVFGTQLYVAQGSTYASDCCLQTALGLLTASTNDGADDVPLLPPTSPCTQQMPSWAFRMSLAMDVLKDDHRYSLAVEDGGTPIRVSLSSYQDHDLTLEAVLADKADDEALESDPWVAVITGTPIDQLSSPSLNQPSIVEVWRFRKIVKIETGSDEESDRYELQEVLRSANKEHPQGWTDGQELWIAYMFREGDVPLVPNGIEGAIGGVADNFTFSQQEFGTWIQLYNDPADLRNGSGGVGAPAITGTTGLSASGHTVVSGVTTYVESTDYEIDQETGKIWIYWGQGISAGNLTITLQLSLSSRWAHRHLSAAGGSAQLSQGAQRVRAYTQCRHLVGQEVLDQEGPLEGITTDFGRADSNFFGTEDRRRSAISPFTDALVVKGDRFDDFAPYDKGWNADRCCVMADVQHILAYADIDWPASFSQNWRSVGGQIDTFSVGFSGEFVGGGRVFSYDTEQGGAAATARGFVIRVEDHAYPGGNKKVPMVKLLTASGTTNIYPLGLDGLNPDGEISGWGIQTENIVVVFSLNGGNQQIDFYIAGVWIGSDVGPTGEPCLSTAGRMAWGRDQGVAAATGHYWDCWLSTRALTLAESRVEDFEPPPDCLFYLPMREPVGTDTLADRSGLKNDFVKQSGTLVADALDTGDALPDPGSYYALFPPHADEGGLGDGWVDSITLPPGWAQMENDAGTDGTDESDMHAYADGAKYPEHQGTWYRLDVYLRWTGLETNPNGGEAFLLRSGRRDRLKDASLYDPMLEVEIDDTRPVEDSDAWPMLVYTESMLEYDKARYEATTVASGADWREADLIFVMYKAKAEVDTGISGTSKLKVWNVPTILPIMGRGQLNYFGTESQRVHASQVNN